MAKFELPPYTFGVEIECFGVPTAVVAWTLNQAKIPAVDLHMRRDSVPSAERALYDEAANGRYTGQTWIIGSDSSVRGVNPMEIKSPILKGMEGIKTLRKVCRLLTGLGIQVNETTGLHVHVGVKGAEGKYAYKATTAVELLKLWTKNEKQIEALIHKSRRQSRNGFCKPASTRLPELLRRIPTEPEIGCEAPPQGYHTWPEYDRANYVLRGHGGYLWARDNRYHASPEPISLATMSLTKLGEYGDHYDAVSLASLLKYGTIEFRLHHGSVDAAEVTSWAMLVVNMVERARKQTEGEVNTGRGRKPGIFCGLPLNLRGHFKAKAKALEAPWIDTCNGVTH